MKQSAKTPFGSTKIYRAEASSGHEQAMVIPGYGESIAHSKKLVDALAKQGFDTLTFSQPRRRGKKMDPIQRQGDIILDVLFNEVPAGERVHAVAHSLGSAAVLKAAQEAPERFASITLMQPVGMVGEQTFPELLGRVGKKVIKNQVGAVRGQTTDIYKKDGHYVASADDESAVKFSTRVGIALLAGWGVLAKQPRLAIQEANASGSYDISEDLARVHQLGVPINIVKAQSDEMFDQHRVDDGYANVADSVSSYSTVADASAQHDTFWMQPERTAKIVEQLTHQS